MAPKREKLEAALDSLRQKEAALAEAKAQLQKLREELEMLQKVYDQKMQEKEDLIFQVTLSGSNLPEQKGPVLRYILCSCF